MGLLYATSVSGVWGVDQRHDITISSLVPREHRRCRRLIIHHRIEPIGSLENGALVQNSRGSGAVLDLGELRRS
jgi:hypothetical protein